jgi:hypothetical protein
MNKDNPDRRLQYCKWFEGIVCKDEEFEGKVIWSDKAQFKMNGTVNRHNCVWCGLSSRDLIGPSFFEGPVTGLFSR